MSLWLKRFKAGLLRVWCLSEVQIPGPDPSPTESGSLGVGSSIFVFTLPQGDSDANSSLRATGLSPCSFPKTDPGGVDKGRAAITSQFSVSR